VIALRSRRGLEASGEPAATPCSLPRSPSTSKHAKSRNSVAFHAAAAAAGVACDKCSAAPSCRAFRSTCRRACARCCGSPRRGLHLGNQQGRAVARLARVCEPRRGPRQRRHRGG
jgi:hypothetical protein